MSTEGRAGRIGAFALFTVGAALLALLALEGGARLFFPAAREPALAFDPGCLGDYRPGQNLVAEKSGIRYRVRINDEGYRGPKPRDGSGPPIVVFGDSFTFGVAVDDEETFSARLEGILRSGGAGGDANRGRSAPDASDDANRTAATPAASVINLGVPSFGLADELHLLREKAPRLAPRAVVLATFMGNDVADELRPAPYREILQAKMRGGAAGAGDADPGGDGAAPPAAAQGGRGGEAPSRTGRGFAATLRDESALYQLLQRRVAAPIAVRQKKSGVFAAPLATLLEAQGRAEFEPTVEALWARYEEHLAAFAAECRRHEWPLVQVLIPTIQVVDEIAASPADFRELNARPYGDAARYAAVAGRLGVRAVSALEPMAADSDPGRYYNSGGDHHLSPEGHRLVASLIARALE